MPLVQWESNSADSVSPIQVPMQKVIAAKQTIVAAGTPETDTLNWQQWLLIVYCVGAVVALCVLLADVYKLYRYYTDGEKSAQDGWTVVFTGKGHAPFSLLNLLFVGTNSQYSPDEWQMVLLHEAQHARLWHLLDLTLMQLARIVCWFHPLVYIYNRRLLMVHEYQADNASATQPKVYGAFLVEQALLQASPSVSHSFNQSPIKTRLQMLKKSSTTLSRMKLLLFIPLVLICGICFSKDNLSDGFHKKGNIITYHGNTFELEESGRDTSISIRYAATGKERKIKLPAIPQLVKTVNGKPLEHVDEQPFFTGPDNDLRSYLCNHLKKELAPLPDGGYSFNIMDILIDENGKIIYFADGDIITSAFNGTEIDKKLKHNLFISFCGLADKSLKFHPATSGGKKVVARYRDGNLHNQFYIRGHKAYDIDKDGVYHEL